MPPKKVAKPAKIAKPVKMGFFKTLVATVYSPEFYAGMKQRTFGEGAWYFLRLVMLYSLIWVGMGTVIIGSIVDFKPGMLVEKAVELYPQDLVVTVHEGRVGINQPEPYLVAQGMIDTQNLFTPEKFKENNVAWWLTSTMLYYQDRGLKNVPLASVPNLVVDRTALSTLGERLSPTLKWMLPSMLIGVWVALALAYFLWGMVYTVLLAVFISILRDLFKLSAAYGVSYRTGLYLMTWVLGAQGAVMLAQEVTGLKPFPFMVSLIALIGLGLNLRNAKREA